MDFLLQDHNSIAMIKTEQNPAIATASTYYHCYLIPRWLVTGSKNIQCVRAHLLTTITFKIHWEYDNLLLET